MASGNSSMLVSSGVHSTPCSRGMAAFSKGDGFVAHRSVVDKYMGEDLAQKVTVDILDFMCGLGASRDAVRERNDADALRISDDLRVSQLVDDYCKRVKREIDRYGTFCKVVKHITSQLETHDLSVSLSASCMIGQAPSGASSHKPADSSPATSDPSGKSTTKSQTKSQSRRSAAKGKSKVGSNSPASRQSAQSSTSGKRLMQEEADIETSSRKRRKSDRTTVGFGKEERQQAFRYGADTMSFVVNRRHCIHGVVADGTLYMVYYDRAGQVWSTGLNFLTDRYLFVLLMKTLAELSPTDCGFSENMEPASMQDVEDIVKAVSPRPSDRDGHEVEPASNTSQTSKEDDTQSYLFPDGSLTSPPPSSRICANGHSNGKNHGVAVVCPTSRDIQTHGDDGARGELLFDKYGPLSPLSLFPSSRVPNNNKVVPSPLEGNADEAEGDEELLEECSENLEEPEKTSAVNVDSIYEPSAKGRQIKAKDLSSGRAWKLNTGSHDVFLLHSLENRIPYGLVTRGGRVFAARSRTLEKDAPGKLYAVNMSWPQARRLPESEKAREELAKLDADLDYKSKYCDKRLIDCLPKVFLCEDLVYLWKKGSFRERAGQVEFLQQHNHAFRVMAFELLVPLYALTDISHFKQAVRDMVLGHHFVFASQSGVFHRDISLDNLMVRIVGNKVHGVLNDWDLAEMTGWTDNTRTGVCTGTRLYMAMDLLVPFPPRHLERFDWESFFYVICWIGCRYSEGKEINKEALVDWNNDNDALLRLAKHSVITGVLTAYTGLEFTEFFQPVAAAWIEPLQELFNAGHAAKGVAIKARKKGKPGEEVSFDEETLGGHITWDKFWEILQN